MKTIALSLVLLALACGSSATTTAQACHQNSDCASTLVCALGACRTRLPPIRTAATLPLEFVVFPSETPIYLRIAPDVDRMQRLGMSISAISKALSLDHTTIRQAVARSPRPPALVRSKRKT
jgi:hypothetical protein